MWKRSMRLVRSVYSATASFPDEEKFGLVTQLRRCAVSVPSNIAEGAARSSAKEFRRFLLMARGSLMEMDTQIWIAKDLGFLDDHGPLQIGIMEILAMLNGLIKNRALDDAQAGQS
ncbi:MAG: four helix bundle protein [Wenzhouxiangellaceae bacterium]|nr:four helix bundle protein [Wenzhouxiangellaceae bacterium]